MFTVAGTIATRRIEESKKQQSANANPQLVKNSQTHNKFNLFPLVTNVLNRIHVTHEPKKDVETKNPSP